MIQAIQDVRKPARDVPRGFWRTPGAELFYRDWGAGRTVVFLHGWALASDMWAYQMLPLSEQGLRCIAYDRRGHGRSSDPGRGYDFDTLADDLAHFLEGLDLREVTLVGHSIASGEMVRYVTRHGSARLNRLVFVAPAATPYLTLTPDNPDGLDPKLVEMMAADLRHDFQKWMDDNEAPYFGPTGSPGKIAWTKQMMLQCSLKAAIDCAVSQATTDFRRELAALRLPSLVLHGSADASAPLDSRGRATARAIPGAELLVYDGAGHGFYATHIDRMNADLLRFMGR